MSSIRSIITLALAAASTVNAHAYFHKAYVNGADQGQFFGVRVPQSNSPIQDVKSSAITCNTGLRSPISSDVIKVAPGDTFGMQWNHVWDGPQSAGDTDDPIAPGHKGPIMAYMAKVSDASTNDGSGLSWFKVAEEGFDTTTRKWAVDSEFIPLIEKDTILNSRSYDRRQRSLVLQSPQSGTWRLPDAWRAPGPARGLRLG
jgi:lytic cellulose monooxygenase (C1-hydroxylating)